MPGPWTAIFPRPASRFSRLLKVNPRPARAGRRAPPPWAGLGAEAWAEPTLERRLTFYDGIRRAEGGAVVCIGLHGGRQGWRGNTPRRCIGFPQHGQALAHGARCGGRAPALQSSRARMRSHRVLRISASSIQRWNISESSNLPSFFPGGGTRALHGRRGRLPPHRRFPVLISKFGFKPSAQGMIA